MPIKLELRDKLIALEVLPPLPEGEANVESYDMLITHRMNGRHQPELAKLCKEKSLTVITIDQSALNAITTLFNEPEIDLLVLSSVTAMRAGYIFAVTIDSQHLTAFVRGEYKKAFKCFIDNYNASK